MMMMIEREIEALSPKFMVLGGKTKCPGDSVPNIKIVYLKKELKPKSLHILI